MCSCFAKRREFSVRVESLRLHGRANRFAFCPPYFLRLLSLISSSTLAQ